MDLETPVRASKRPGPRTTSDERSTLAQDQSQTGGLWLARLFCLGTYIHTYGLCVAGGERRAAEALLVRRCLCSFGAGSRGNRRGDAHTHNTHTYICTFLRGGRPTVVDSELIRIGRTHLRISDTITYFTCGRNSARAFRAPESRTPLT